MSDSSVTSNAASSTSPFPPINAITWMAPVRWLGDGWRDLMRAPAASMFYGVMFALMGWTIQLAFRHRAELTSSLTAGFLLVGPFLATGLYDISRRQQRGERVLLRPTLAAWKPHIGAFGLFALGLTLILLLWARASLVTFALFFSEGMPTLTNFFGQVASAEHIDFLVTYFALGALFAALVFAVSVVSVPMMLDRGTDPIVAALTSIRALVSNPGPLFLWALFIVAIVGIGFATLFIGLVIAVPWIGHATWHAYCELVGAEREQVP